MKRLLQKKTVAMGVAMTLLIGVYGRGIAQNREGDDESGLDVTLRSDDSLTATEKIRWVEGKTEEARRISHVVQNMLDRARKDKDTLKITCLNDKLTQIHVNLRGVEERTQAMRTAVDSGDTTTANQQFAILRIYISRIEGLKAEADNCLGEVDVVLGETDTVITVDDDITPEDPSADVPIVDDIGIDQPPHASGFF
jgi:hypothetical protein